MDLLKQLVHPAGVLEAAVLTKRKRRNVANRERFCQVSADESRGSLEAGQAILHLSIGHLGIRLRGAQDRNEDRSIAPVLGDLHLGESHGRNSRVLDLAGDELGQFFLDSRLKTLSSGFLHGDLPAYATRLRAELRRDHLDLVGFDDVTWLEVVIVLQPDTALEAAGDFLGVVFKAT